MGGKQCQIMIAEEGKPGAVRHRNFNMDDLLQVREISNRLVHTVFAKEVSAYRHTLFLEGKAYRILNVIKRS